MSYRYKLRASSRIIQIELQTAEDFYDHTSRFFERQIKQLDARGKKHPQSYWDHDMGAGITRGEIVSEERAELEGFMELAGHFGIIMAYSAFERFLLHLYKLAKTFHMTVPLEVTKKKWLYFEDYVKYLKENGIDLTGKPIRYKDILKLRGTRNVIAHNGGWVSEESPKELRKSYRVGTQVVVSETEFRSSINLVRETCEHLAKLFEQRLETSAGRRQAIKPPLPLEVKLRR